MGDRRPRSPPRDRNRDRQDQPRNPGYDQRGGFRRDNRKDEPPRRDDRRYERDYRRRSRSPRRDRRDDRYAKDKDGTTKIPERGAPRPPVAPRDRDRSRSPRRDRDRDRNLKRDDRRRSRSPRREKGREWDSKRDGTKDRETSPRRERDREPEVKKEEDKIAEQARLQVRDEEFTKSRTATPPVSFKVGGAVASKDESAARAGQDHDRMDVDKPSKKGKTARKERAEESDDEVDIVVEDDGLAAMQAMMGFGGFGTTHQKKVAGNDISAVRKEKKTEYRQYMNRVGGFNRPLDEMS